MKNNISDKKFHKLTQYLKRKKKVLIAFSGGVDSTFLLAVSKKVLAENVYAVTIKTPYIPDWEIEEARQTAKKLKVDWNILNLEIPSNIINNPEERCYLCKYQIFGKIKEYALNLGIKFIFDGTNYDDQNDFRPGMRALKELNICSPLLENHLTKKEIREFSKRIGLKTWDKPAYACLLTRIPFNTKITSVELERIEKAELFLMKMNYKAVRVRSHGDLTRIEINPENIANFVNDKNLNKIIKYLKKIGYKYISLDLEGYRTGSLK